MTDTESRQTIALAEAIKQSGVRRETAFAWVKRGLVGLAPKVQGDQRTYVYLDDWLKQSARPRRRGRQKASAETNTEEEHR